MMTLNLGGFNFESEDEVEELKSENKQLNDIISAYKYIIETYIDKDKINDIRNDISNNDDISNDEKNLLLKIL